MRSDTERNRRRLIHAAAALVARHGAGVRMVDVAERAEVSVATAYRHFGSVGEILDLYRLQVGTKLLEYSRRQSTEGVELLTAVSRHWVKLAVRHGAAMVHSRSEEGYLERLHAGVPHLTVQAEALRPGIVQSSHELGIADPGDGALLLWNALFDPREIFDLMGTMRLSQDEVAERLMAAFLAAMAGWVRAAVPSGVHAPVTAELAASDQDMNDRDAVGVGS